MPLESQRKAWDKVNKNEAGMEGIIWCCLDNMHKFCSYTMEQPSIKQNKPIKNIAGEEKVSLLTGYYYTHIYKHEFHKHISDT